MKPSPKVNAVNGPLPDPMLATRRHFLSQSGTGIGMAALASLAGRPADAAPSRSRNASSTNDLQPHFPAKAKRVIYLFQSGAPAQMDLFDYKPKLKELHKSQLPDSVRMGQRLTGMTSGQESLPVAASMFPFRQRGESGTWLSEIMPHLANVVDDLCVVKSMHTEAINHDPAITLFQTGFQQPGRPSLGTWVTYGLGSTNQNLPSFVVLISQGTGRPVSQPLYARLWGSGFLPSNYQGVKFRSVGDPVLYLSDPPGFSNRARQSFLGSVSKLNQLQYEKLGDPEIATRIAQYEMAFRMQTSVPELMDISGETKRTLEQYGPESQTPGTYAANCLLARRLAERGVRFIQLYHRGWDHHDNLPKSIMGQCRDTDQPTAALIADLKQRGLLDDTLIVWGGEFGRTVYCQGKLTKNNYGRDHHPRCFSVFFAGGGIKGGMSYGQTDDFCYNIVSDPVHVHDLQATILHCLGIDHEKLTFKFQGRHYRLTDVHGNVVEKILA